MAGRAQSVGGVGDRIAGGHRVDRDQQIGVHGQAPGETGIALERLVIERALSVNTAAAGGNASLMTIG